MITSESEKIENNIGIRGIQPKPLKRIFQMETKHQFLKKKLKK